MTSPILTALDRINDRDNSVTLLDLRRAAGLSRPEFDAELRRLRIAGVLCLSASDRYSTPEIDAAAIIERGERMTHCHKR